MTRKRKPYKTYTREFKQEAIRMMEEPDRPAAELARELGIRRNQLYKWKEQLRGEGEQACSGNRGRPKKESQSELATLRQENERLKEALEILKKAAAYFARELK
ncbi:MAG: transposase [Gammaproteobacteria bacterium]|nr:transposase [Gammaproteobacteria bacterium]